MNIQFYTGERGREFDRRGERWKKERKNGGERKIYKK